MNFLNYLKEDKDKIKVLILASKKDGDEDDVQKTAGRLKEVCDEMGIENHVIFSNSAYIERDKNNIPRIHNIDDKKGIILDKTNTVAIVRGSTKETSYNLDLLSQIERHEIFCVNTRDTVEICADKWRTILTVANVGLTAPKTALISGMEGLKVGFEKIGGDFPVVLKTITGSKGIGVFTASDWPSMTSTLQTIWKINPDVEILIQEFINNNFDLRIHVLGGKVIAAMKRFKIKNDFRSNYSLGGKIKKATITDEQKEIAIKAAKAVGAIWCGVDMMEGTNGKSFIIEINSSPGTEGIEIASGVKVVEKVVNYITNKKNWIKEPIEVGYLEKVEIEGFGELDAKLDTGNGGRCIIHADSWKIDGNNITWTFGDKKYKKKTEGIKKVKLGGLEDGYEERPHVRLDITFLGSVYKDFMFVLTDRKEKTTPVLLNRHFIRKANLMINPAKKYAMTLKEPEKLEEADVKKPKEMKKDTKKVDTKKADAEKKRKADAEKKKKQQTPGAKTSKVNKAWWDALSGKAQAEWLARHPKGDVKTAIDSREIRLKGLNEPGKELKPDAAIPVDGDKKKKGEEPTTQKKGVTAAITKEPPKITPEQEKNVLGMIKIDDKTGLETLEIPEGHELTPTQCKDILYNKIYKEMEDKDTAGETRIRLEDITQVDGTVTITARNKTLMKKNIPKSGNYGGKVKTENKDHYKKNSNVYEKGKRLSIDNDLSFLRSGKYSNYDLDVFERLANATNADKYKSLAFFTEGDSGGQGTIQSQAGELLTLIMIGLDDADADKVKKVLLNILDTNRGGDTKEARNRIDAKYQLTRDWVETGFKARKAMKKIIDKKFAGKNYKIDDCVEYVCWDREEAVKAIGMDYTQKEPSTDVFLVLKDPKTGKKQIVEISLKKTFGTKLLNSGLGLFIKSWRKSGIKVPNHIDPQVYGKQQKKMYEDATKENERVYKNKVIDVLKGDAGTGSGELQKSILHHYMSKKGLGKGKDTLLYAKPDGKPDYEKIWTDLKNFNTGGFKKRKMWMKIHQYSAQTKGVTGEKSYQLLKDLKDYSHKWTKNSLRYIKNDPILKHEVLKILRDRLPLRAISSGFESMIVGDKAVTEDVIKKLFGTTDWSKIRENIVIDNSGPEPIVTYVAVPNNGEPIKLGKIVCREDGIPYGGSGRIKFDVEFYNKAGENTLPNAVQEATMESYSIFAFHMLNEKFNDEYEYGEEEEDPDDNIDKWLEEFEKEGNYQMRKPVLHKNKDGGRMMKWIDKSIGPTDW